jgi:phosphatidylglycerophosphate synthase
MASPLEHSRRPLAVRSAGWVKKIASILTRSGISPNTISLMSMLFAALGAVLLWLSAELTGAGRVVAYICAAVLIQLRLLCNLFDGMVAVEGQRFTKSGELFNEVPDRVSDTLLIVALGYALPSLDWAVELSWLTALLAMMTAYIRLLGSSCGLKAEFLGPMAKQQRMALMTGALLLAALFSNAAVWILAVALVVMVVGDPTASATKACH